MVYILTLGVYDGKWHTINMAYTRIRHGISSGTETRPKRARNAPVAKCQVTGAASPASGTTEARRAAGDSASAMETGPGGGAVRSGWF